MNIPIQVVCSNCKNPGTIKLHLDATSFDWTCERCGKFHPFYKELETTVGLLIFLRSKHELTIERDYSMAIVLAAMAVESEMSNTYCRWKRFEAICAGTYTSEDDSQKACEEELRRSSRPTERITMVCEFLCPGGLQRYIESSKEGSSFINTLNERLFRRRNRILHHGIANWTKADAESSLRIAELALEMLRKLESEKRKTLPQ